jgi:hypothetical protein
MQLRVQSWIWHPLLSMESSDNIVFLLQTEAEAVASRLSIPNTRFDLQYVRPDFIMLRVIARNLIMWSRFVLVSLC